ncbi:MAG: hypothetical protein L6R28_10340 [Planctomycetes bacterium]|nr:hypothetical protein [Planctomycetota bacterium]
MKIAPYERAADGHPVRGCLVLVPQILDGLEERGTLYFGNTLSFDLCNVRRGSGPSPKKDRIQARKELA